MSYAGYNQALDPPGYDEELAKVGPGTPCGEFFRRYWHPVAIAADVGELPCAVRILGESIDFSRQAQAAAYKLFSHESSAAD